MKIKKRETKLKPENFRELLETADLIGDFIEYWGFKKVQGRIWASLFLMSEPLNTRQLMELLNISSFLVSISVAELMKYGVILEAGKGRNGVLL
jgi:HTH-type transcriptional regulator, glycine betaine synthesis regulator